MSIHAIEVSSKENDFKPAAAQNVTMLHSKYQQLRESGQFERLSVVFRRGIESGRPKIQERGVIQTFWSDVEGRLSSDSTGHKEPVMVMFALNRTFMDVFFVTRSSYQQFQGPIMEANANTQTPLPAAQLQAAIENVHLVVGQTKSLLRAAGIEIKE